MKNKVLHYCWFGGAPFPEIVKKCMESWKQFCPDYEIIEWNESNFDIHCCKYVEQAYEAKKWAFVSDYCRFFVLYNYGGIYLDTDVELIKPIDDLPQNFVGFENKSTIASGLIRGALIRDTVCKLMLESYRNDKFILSKGKQNLETVCERETAILSKYGLKLDGTMQCVLNTYVYPTEYFCPINPLTFKKEITPNTISIHHYSATWCSEEDKKYFEIRAKYMENHSRKVASFMAYYKIYREKISPINALFKTIKVALKSLRKN